MQRLEQLGWNAHFHEAFAGLGTQTLVPARIISEHRGLYRIAAAGGEMPAEVTGRMIFLAEERCDYPVVGDWVAVEVFDQGTHAVIHGILPRRTLLARKQAGKKLEGQALAANVDIIFAVVGLDGNFNLNRVERLVAAAAASGAEPVVVLSKSDLDPDADGKARQVHSRAGVAAIPASAGTGTGIRQVRDLLTAGATACFIGSSGVGKSSLINRLAGRELVRTGEVREFDSKGRHTTTHRELFLLDGGGIVIDTPGMRELGLWESAAGIQKAFDDIETLGAGGAFSDCRHQAEPGCAVRAAVEAGDLDSGRYESYRKLRREQEHLDAKTDLFARLEKKARDRSLSKAVREVKRKDGK